MAKIKIVAIEGSHFLDDKGRVWHREMIWEADGTFDKVPTAHHCEWRLVDLPDEPQD